MHMSFWWGYDFGDFFFKGATIHSSGGTFLLCAIFLGLTIAYQGLKALETKLQREYDANLKKSTLGACSDDRNDLLRPDRVNRNVSTSAQTNSRFICSYKTKALRVLLYTTNSSVNYLIMLAIMLYNGFLFVSIVAGIFIGYFVFGPVGDFHNRKFVIGTRKVGIVCTPEFGEDENRSTPPITQRELHEGTSTCTVQIESTSKLDDEDTNFDGEDALVKKSSDLSKIKNKHTDAKDEADCCGPQDTDDD